MDKKYSNPGQLYNCHHTSRLLISMLNNKGTKQVMQGGGGFLKNTALKFGRRMGSKVVQGITPNVLFVLTSKKTSLEKKSFFVLLIMTPKWKETNIGDTSPLFHVFPYDLWKKENPRSSDQIALPCLVFSITGEKIC